MFGNYLLPEKLLLARILSPKLVEIKRRNAARREHLCKVAIVDTDAFALEHCPRELDTEGREDVSPAAPMERLGISEDAVEIEQDGIVMFRRSHESAARVIILT